MAGGNGLPRNVRQTKHKPKRVAKRNEKKNNKEVDVASAYRNVSSKRVKVAWIIFINVAIGAAIALLFIVWRQIMSYFGKEDRFPL